MATSDVALSIPSLEGDALSNANKPRLSAISTHVLMRQFSALRVAVYATRYKSANLFVGEDEIVRFIDAHPKLFAGSLDQLNEVGVTEIHVRKLASKCPLSTPFETLPQPSPDPESCRKPDT